jgi:antitoxin component YwqK of YwqJK toxin-antitoxin module
MLFLCLLLWLFSATISSGLGAAEETSEERIKRIFRETVERHGYVLSEGANDAIRIQSPKLAQAEQERKGVVEHEILKNGKRDGFFYAEYDNGKPQRVGYYASGIMVGPWLFYYKSGSIDGQITYNALGKEEGQARWYHSNGNLDHTEQYENGVKTGAKNTFYDTGMPYIHQQWNRGVMHGLSVIYHPNGQIKKMGHFVNGKQHGTVTMYNDDGSIKETIQYLDGVRQ